MNHYTYMIKANDMFYIGARSCECLPEDDIYYSSSKTLKAWYKSNKEKVIKHILAIFPSRELALEHEIELHNFYDVARNKLFWNKAKQSAVGFDTTGTHIPKSEEHKRKIGLAHKGRIISEEQKEKQSQTMTGRKRTQEQIEKQRNSMFGKKHSEETKAKISFSSKGKKCSDKQKQTTSKIMQGMVVCFDMEQKKSVKITKEEYHSNKNRYKNNYSKEVRELENK